jgi:hypothetical protein
MMTQTAAHTPGPWSIDSNDRDYIRADADGFIVAEVMNGDGEYSGVTMEANALLIATAPEMGNALAETISDLQAYLEDEPDPEVKAHYQQRLEKSRVLLKKAGIS